MLDPMPLYYEKLISNLSPEYLDMINLFERNFQKLNYTAHIDKLNLTFLEPDHTFSELVDLAINIYKECIEYIFEQQGIFLIDIYSINTHTLELMFDAVTVLVTQDIRELNDGNNLSNAEDSIEYLAECIEFLTQINHATIMTYLKIVKRELIEFIKIKYPLNISENTVDEKIKLRFLKFDINKESVVRDYIIQINKFGFDLEIALKVLGEHISDIEDDQSLTDEIILLCLGSNLKDEDLEVNVLLLIDKLIQDVNRKLKLNILINKKFKLLGES